MTPSFSKVTIRDVGYTKRNKRCIPKEGMPHARKSMLQKKEKKREDANPKKVCHMPTRHVKKKREKKIAHIQEK